MSDCVFCKIVAGEIPSFKLYEDKDFLAFMDINPVAEGHCLVIPKQHCESFRDFDPALMGDYFAIVQRLALKVCGVLGAPDFNVVNASGVSAQQTVGHLHFHVVPRRPGDGIDIWFHGKKKYSTEELGALAKKLAL
jgi:histidine triad (HIT) family protein